MSASPNQSTQPFAQSHAQQSPGVNCAPTGTFGNPGYGMRNSFALGSNFSVGGGISFNITDNSQVITGDGMSVTVTAPSRFSTADKQESVSNT